MNQATINEAIKQDKLIYNDHHGEVYALVTFRDLHFEKWQVSRPNNDETVVHLIDNQDNVHTNLSDLKELSVKQVLIVYAYETFGFSGDIK